MAKRDIAGWMRQASMKFNVCLWSDGVKPANSLECDGHAAMRTPHYGLQMPIRWRMEQETKRRQRPLSSRKVKHIRCRYMRIG